MALIDVASSFARPLVTVLLLTGCVPDAEPQDDDIGEETSDTQPATDGPDSDTEPVFDCELDEHCDFGASCDSGVCSAGDDPIESCGPESLAIRANLDVVGAGAFVPADVDGDGVTELVVVDDAGVRTYELLGDTTTSSALALTPGIARKVTVLQSDGDGLPDVAISAWDADTVQIFHGDGAGGFAGEVGRTPPSPATELFRLRAGTGVDRLLVRTNSHDEQPNNLHLYAEEGDDAPVQAFVGGTSDIEVADLDGDEVDELLLLEQGELAIWRADADTPTYTSKTFTAIAHPFAFDTCDSIGAADLDHDGLVELVCTANRTGTNAAVGVWTKWGDDYQRHDAVIVSGSASVVTFADLEGDDRPELLISSQSFIRPTGGTGFYCQDQSTIAGLVPQQAADLDGDGREELIGLSMPGVLTITSLE